MAKAAKPHAPKHQNESVDVSRVPLEPPDLALTAVQPYCPQCGSAVPFSDKPPDVFGLWIVRCGNCDWLGHSRKYMRQTAWDGQ